MARLVIRVWIVAVLAVGAFAAGAASHAPGEGAGGADWVGWLSLVWSDRPQWEPDPSAILPRIFLTTDNGKHYELVMDDPPVGWLVRWNGRRVGVAVDRARTEARRLADGAVVALSAGPPPGEEDVMASPAPAVGTRHWVSICCKFQDIPDEPKPISFFQDMYGNEYPRLDHYWREVSYDKVNLSGSTAVGWYTLPHPRSYYIPSEQVGSARLGALWDDAVALADPVVDFSQFDGVNLMFNGGLDGAAYGGRAGGNLDGVTKTWYTTWEPDWGWGTISVMQHEMGHGMGLPHSTCFIGNSTAWNPNAWDIMGGSGLGPVYDPVYGHVGMHAIAQYKDRLGWIPDDRKVTVQPGQTATVTIERLSQPRSSNPLLVQVPFNGSSGGIYTVEARQLAGYDNDLPGNAVIVHEVDDFWARIIDAGGNCDTEGAGPRWLPGKPFTGPGGCVSVTVESATATGWVVTVTNNTPTLTAGSSLPAVPQGQRSALSVDASGQGPFTYQWYMASMPEGVVVSLPIPGATGSAFSTWRLYANAGFFVRVTGPCGYMDSPTIEVPVFSRFDLNVDGRVDGSDAAALAALLAGNPADIPGGVEWADVNGDGYANVLDLLAVKAPRQLVAGDVVETDPVVGNLREALAGVYLQGSDDLNTPEPCRYTDESHFLHFVTGPLAVMETEVTRQMWADLKAAQPSLPSDPSNASTSAGMSGPVQKATWYEAVLYANLLSATRGLRPCYYSDAGFTKPIAASNYKTGPYYCDFDSKGYRLPTEGEWERFCRAGETSPFWVSEPGYGAGSCASCSQVLPMLDKAAWYCGNSGGVDHPAGGKWANPWNLKDVHGSVQEWCWDVYGPYPHTYLGLDAVDYRGPSTGGARVLRGGGRSSTPQDCRSACRSAGMPGMRDGTVGFRLCRASPN